MLLSKMMTKQLIFTEQNFIEQFNLPKVTFEEFCDRISVLNITDKSGTFAVRANLNDFVDKVCKKDTDTRKERLDLYKNNLYKILVTDADKTLQSWFKRYGELKEPIDFYLNIPRADILNEDDKVFTGRTLSKYGKLCKNINFVNFYNTKKLYDNDSEYTFGLMKVMFEEFKIRNSLVGPAFFDHICKYEGDSGQFWLDFMIGANRASIFNPTTYRGILDNIFTGETLFAPVMGWNAYQLGFYNSKFTNFIATDVIPDVVQNGSLLHEEYKKYQNDSIFVLPEKNVDLYLCPSEQLDAKHNFSEKYADSVDAVLLSPPYFDLEIYPSEDQSFTSFPDYQSWLIGYWEETIKLCVKVMKPGAKLGFVISNYRNVDKQEVSISQDMRDIAAKHLTLIDQYRVQWSAISGTRQAKKTRDGNFEDLWVFEK
jgi:hypothetical protein